MGPLGKRKIIKALGFASDGQKTIQKGGRVLGNDIFQFDYSGPILTPVLNYDEFYPPYPPSLEPPLGNQFTLGLEKKKRILVVLNLLYQNLQKSGYLKFQQTVPLNS